MFSMKIGKTFFISAIFVALITAGSVANAGPMDSPVPQLAVGKTARVVGFVPGVIKNNGIETLLFCSNLEPTAVNVHVGFEIFDPVAGAGTGQGAGPLNNVAIGIGGSDGSVTIPFGGTATISTGSTVAFAEDDIIVGLPINVRNGIGRIVSTSKRIACNVFAADEVFSPPTSIVPLRVILRGQKGD